MTTSLVLAPSFSPALRRRVRALVALVAAVVLTVCGVVVAGSPAVAYPTCASASSDPDGDGWGWENGQSCQVAAGSGSTYPTCASASSDPDGDGWGWENGQSCKVAAGSGSTYPTCASASSDPDGDGWGWENGQSCKVAAGSGSGSSACPSGATCGSYTVSGLGSRKQQILNAGGTTLDLAIAMLESDNMTTSYAYGDNKTYDAANFGIFKQNWLMLRTACSTFRGQTQAQWNNGAALNTNLSADISCRHQAQTYYGHDRWFAGHRNGETGLNNPNTADILAYRTAVYWIKAQLDASSSNLSNNTRFWVNVPPI